MNDAAVNRWETFVPSTDFQSYFHPKINSISSCTSQPMHGPEGEEEAPSPGHWALDCDVVHAQAAAMEHERRAEVHIP